MYWYEGELINSDRLQLNINEPGLLYGASIFTTLRVYEKSIKHPLTDWQSHCDRLSQSLSAFKWQQPNWQNLSQGAKELAAYFPVLRMMIFPDGKELISGRNLPLNLKQRQTEGITAWVATGDLYKRDLASHKTGNYLGAYLARTQASNFNASEAILIDRHRNWLETSTGNLWGWRDGCWYTPRLDRGILPGIERSHLLKFFQKQNILVQENLWTPQFTRTLKSIFYSNCVVKMIPIKEVLDSGEHIPYSIGTFP